MRKFSKILLLFPIRLLANRVPTLSRISRLKVEDPRFRKAESGLDIIGRSSISKRKLLVFVLIGTTFYFFLISNFVFAQIIIPRQPVPGVPGLTLIELSDIIGFVGSFFTTIGPLLAVIAIIISGITYMRAGGDELKVKKAKAWLKNALIGALIVLAVGLIINTIANIVTREFFCRLSFFGKCVF